MSQRRIPVAGRELVDLLRSVLDRMDRVEKGGTIAGQVSFGETIQVGGVLVATGADGDAATLDFLDAGTGDRVYAPSAPDDTIRAGAVLDYAKVETDSAAVSATTEGAAVALITGNPVAYDGGRVRVEAFFPRLLNTTSTRVTFVVLRDADVVCQVGGPNMTGTATVSAAKVEAFDNNPGEATHVYSIAVFVNTAAVTAEAAAGGPGALSPMWLLVTSSPLPS